jgi:hypothetical protein
MYAIGMRLTFHNIDGDVSVDGVGLSTAEIDVSSGAIDKRANAIAFAQKTARSTALQNAFEKVLSSYLDSQISPKLLGQ